MRKSSLYRRLTIAGVGVTLGVGSSFVGLVPGSSAALADSEKAGPPAAAAQSRAEKNGTGKSKGKAVGQTQAKGEAKGRSGSAPHGKALGHGKGKGKAFGQAQGQGEGRAHGQSGAPAPGAVEESTGPNDGDPAGNNGTVKIAALGDIDGIPENTPHPGCTFQVEWYGYDGGPEVISTVSFAMQAPTSDATLAVDGPTSVPVGGDPASGAGTDTGLDAVATYTLSFDGEPHAQQGYHVKLTVATPHSNGNDTKTKVFWVEPCTATPPAVGGSAVGGGALGGTGTGDSGTASGEQAVLGSFATAGSATAMEGSTARAAAADEAPVPLAVDAGTDTWEAMTGWARSPLGLGLLAWALLLGGTAALMRRRARA